MKSCRKEMTLIKHLAARVEGVSFNALNDVRFLSSLADEIVKQLKMKALRKLAYKFNPQGVSILYLLAESHIAMHSWPEQGLLDLVIVSCKRSSDVMLGLKVAIDWLKPKKVEHNCWVCGD